MVLAPRCGGMSFLARIFLSVLLIALAPLRAEEPAPWVHEVAVNGTAESAAKFRAALDRQIAWQYEATSLGDIVADLEKRLGLPFSLDVPGLEEVGCNAETQFDFQAEKLSVRSGLTLLLSQHGLTFYRRAGNVIVTSPDAVTKPRGGLEIKIYAVPEPAAPSDEWNLGRQRPFVTSVVPVVGYGGVYGGGRAEPITGYGALAELLRTMIDPNSWSEVGGPATLEIAPRRGLVIAQTWENHERIERLLSVMLRLKSERAKEPAAGAAFLSADGADELREKLGRIEDLKFAGDLQEFARLLEQKLGRTVLLSRTGLDEVGLTGETKLEGRSDREAFHAGISSLLRAAGLDYSLRRDAMLITNVDAAASPSNASLAVIPVADLLPADAESAAEECEELCSLITTTIDASNWQEVGGPGILQTWHDPPALVVSQQDESLYQVAALLAQLRKTKPATPPKPELQKRVFVIRSVTRAEYKGGKVTVEQVDKKGKDQTDDKSSTTTVTAAAAETMPALIEFIRRNVAPDRWKETGVGIDHWQNRLSIRHEPAVIRKTAELLHKMDLIEWTPWAPDGTIPVIGFTSQPGGAVGGFFAVPAREPRTR